MTDRRIHAAHLSMRAAAEALHLVDLQLQTARKDYAASALPAGVRKARIEALDAKIAAVRDLRTDAVMHPWAGDATLTLTSTTAAPPAPTAGSTP